MYFRASITVGLSRSLPTVRYQELFDARSDIILWTFMYLVALAELASRVFSWVWDGARTYFFSGLLSLFHSPRLLFVPFNCFKDIYV